jgi:hypothetical protein
VAQPEPRLEPDWTCENPSHPTWQSFRGYAENNGGKTHQQLSIVGKGPVSKHFTVSLHLLITWHVTNNIWFDFSGVVIFFWQMLTGGPQLPIITWIINDVSDSWMADFLKPGPYRVISVCQTTAIMELNEYQSGLKTLM